MAAPLANIRPLWPVVLIMLLQASSPASGSFRQRQASVDPPPIVPAERFWPQDRAKRSLLPPVQPEHEELNPERLTIEDARQVLAGYLLVDPTDQRLLNLSDPLDRNLSQILDRQGPDMRPSRDYHDFKDISLDMSKRAWSLMREHAKIALQLRTHLAWPPIERLLAEARVSGQCVEAISKTFSGARRLESWAVKLLNSWGTFPTSGLFEGTYGDVGAFFTCVGIDQNKYIDHAHYCSVTFRPVMTSPVDYDLIVRKEPAELRMMFEQHKVVGVDSSKMGRQTTGNSTTRRPYSEQKSERDAMTDLLDLAQYHHFLYYKWGTCWPIACSPFDVRRVAKLVGRKNVLMSGPVKCYSMDRDDYEQEFVEVDGRMVPDFGANSTQTKATTSSNNNADTTADAAKRQKLVISVWDKNGGIFIWKPHFSRAQKVAAGILIALTIFIATMTLIDLCVNKIPWLYRKLVLSLKALPLSKGTPTTRNGPVAAGEIATKFGALCTAHGAATPKPSRRHLGRVAGFQMVPSDPGARLDANNNAFGCVVAATNDGQDDDDDDSDNGSETLEPVQKALARRQPVGFMRLVDDCSAFSNFRIFFHVTESQLKNDILCLHGIRCITMVWIITTHTMAYNDWSAFARTREIEIALNSLLSQPLFNGSYLVDTFFLMSGLLSAVTAFRHCQGLAEKFNSFAYIFGRWLRLTPQIFIMSMVYIVLPAWSYGPHWYPIAGEYSENCVTNWWINVLHLQAFYKTDHMCNFVTWWISIDFFYHFIALLAIWIILKLGHKWGFWSMAALVASAIAWQSKRHYELALPPNILSTIPQTGAMWTTMTLEFYWTPYAHSVPFFFGFYIGYLMALKTKVVQQHLNSRRALIGWTLSISLLLAMQYSTYWWVTGKAGYSKPVSTLFFGACSIVWNGSICWIIIACQHGYGGFINRMLSWKVFIVLGKASYLIYLSHFQVLFMYFGNQTLLIEPTTITMVYAILGNIFTATIYGVLMCCIYEIPWLKFHRRLMQYF